jgi:hypothetical protein
VESAIALDLSLYMMHAANGYEAFALPRALPPTSCLPSSSLIRRPSLSSVHWADARELKKTEAGSTLLGKARERNVY